MSESHMEWNPTSLQEAIDALRAGTHEVTIIESTAFVTPGGEGKYVDPNDVFLDALGQEFRGQRLIDNPVAGGTHARTPEDLFVAPAVGSVFITDSLQATRDETTRACPSTVQPVSHESRTSWLQHVGTRGVVEQLDTSGDDVDASSVGAIYQQVREELLAPDAHAVPDESAITAYPCDGCDFANGVSEFSLPGTAYASDPLAEGSEDDITVYFKESDDTVTIHRSRTVKVWRRGGTASDDDTRAVERLIGDVQRCSGPLERPRLGGLLGTQQACGALCEHLYEGGGKIIPRLGYSKVK